MDNVTFLMISTVRERLGHPLANSVLGVEPILTLVISVLEEWSEKLLGTPQTRRKAFPLPEWAVTLGRGLQGPLTKHSRRIRPQTKWFKIKELLVQSIISKYIEIRGDKNGCPLQDTEHTKSDGDSRP